MTLAQFYALIPALTSWKHRAKCAQAAHRLGDLLARGVEISAAIANVTARRDLADALDLAGLDDDFATITGL
jgi:hypothetical protein